MKLNIRNLSQNISSCSDEHFFNGAHVKFLEINMDEDLCLNQKETINLLKEEFVFIDPIANPVWPADGFSDK